ncbi:sugar nucleotide-binding protein [Candidatus Gottesmanbacteria bacterium]|nr:sugar nucleotide-binding protein [Candidatus Gottesmanbacteria bacterium]
MKILIIGASSYVGARIYYDLQSKYTVVGTYHNNPLFKSFIPLNATSQEEISRILHEVKPDVIVQVANYPSPRNAVNNEKNFIALNHDATKLIVDTANHIGAKVIFISSQAANNQTDIYGKLKANSEELVKTVKAGYLILRPSLIVGLSPNTANDRPFNRILRCLDDGASNCEFDTSWKLQPSYIGHLSGVIDGTMKNNGWNKVIPVFINEIVTQYQIARDILSEFHVSVGQKDAQLDIPTSTNDLTDFRSFGLKPDSYATLIQVIVEEIKNRETFRL